MEIATQDGTVVDGRYAQLQELYGGQCAIEIIDTIEMLGLVYVQGL